MARSLRRRWSTASSSSAAGFRYRDQAVLCRGNDRLSDTGQELERAGVPVLFLGSLFERTEIKDLVAVLLLLVDRRAMGLIRTACWPEFAMTLEDAVRVFERFAAPTFSLVRGGREHRTSLQPGRPRWLP
jgi:ATP-dependent exoDNAse (exonuclease V) beta subunit